jgi:hypothetical protein
MNAQRALWTFLLFTLVGPFIAAVLAVIYTPLAIWANWAPFTAGDHPPFDLANIPGGGGLAQVMAAAALQTFVWTPIAAAVAGIGLVVLLFTRGEVGWALAGVAGVVGFFVGYVYKPFEAGQLLPAFAAAAGIVAVLLSLFLVRINVLPRPS